MGVNGGGGGGGSCDGSGCGGGGDVGVGCGESNNGSSKMKAFSRQLALFLCIWGTKKDLALKPKISTILYVT